MVFQIKNNRKQWLTPYQKDQILKQPHVVRMASELSINVINKKRFIHKLRKTIPRVRKLMNSPMG